MPSVTQRQSAATKYLPGRGGIVVVTLTAAAGFMSAVGGLLAMISFLPTLGWPQFLALAALCVGPHGAIWAAHYVRTSQRIHAGVPRALLDTRFHGNLDAVLGHEGRSLRPIGTTPSEVADRTGSLLGHLARNPCVRIFFGVTCPNAAIAQVLPHAVVAGRQIILVESVAWPSGQYQVDTDGRIKCDGTYIGQSVAPLMAAVRCWRELLPRNHRVSALIVVHAAGTGQAILPAESVPGLMWARAEDALATISNLLPRNPALSLRAFVALLGATRSR